MLYSLLLQTAVHYGGLIFFLSKILYMSWCPSRGYRRPAHLSVMLVTVDDHHQEWLIHYGLHWYSNPLISPYLKANTSIKGNFPSSTIWLPWGMTYMLRKAAQICLSLYSPVSKWVGSLESFKSNQWIFFKVSLSFIDLNIFHVLKFSAIIIDIQIFSSVANEIH